MEEVAIKTEEEEGAPLPPPPMPPTVNGMVLEGELTNIKIEDMKTEDGVAQAESANNENSFTGKVVRITNVSSGATLQQLATLFGYLGTVQDIRMYPTEENLNIKVRLCYIKYDTSEQCGVAQHLTNTVFIDKPLIVVPMNREEIPDEKDCQHLISTINAYAAAAGTGFLPQFFPHDTSNGTGLPGLPPPPVITTTTDPVEIEEIKRTIFVEDIAEVLTSEQLMAFFSGVGEVKYLRFSKGEDGDGRFAFIEFTNLESVPTALQYNGVLFGGQCLKVQYSKHPIVKPESERIASGRNAVRKSQRDAVKRPSSVEPRPRVFTSRSRSRSRSPSRSRRRSPSRERRRRRSNSRTRSPRRRRSRSRSRSPRRRSPRRRSPRRSRSRSAGRVARRRSRSKSRSPRRRRKSRSRSRDRRRRRKSPTKSPSRSPRRRKRKSKSRSKSRSISPKRKSSRKSISRSPDRSSSSKKKKKDKKKEKEKDEGKSQDKELKNLLNKIKTFEEKTQGDKKEKKGSEEPSTTKKEKDKE